MGRFRLYVLLIYVSVSLTIDVNSKKFSPTVCKAISIKESVKRLFHQYKSPRFPARELL